MFVACNTATFVYAGGWIGNVICLLSSGLLSASILGWPSCFYIWGGLTIISSILFFIIGRDSPTEHPGIPLDEKEYIETSLGIVETDEVRCFCKSGKVCLTINFSFARFNKIILFTSIVYSVYVSNEENSSKNMLYEPYFHVTIA